MSIFYIDCDREKTNSAGAKAPDDIAALCEMRGYKRFIVPTFPEKKSKAYKKVWLVFNCKSWWKRLSKTLKDGDTVLFQHPSYGKSVAADMIKKIKAKKNVCFIAIIHDLESLRGGISGLIKENKQLHLFGDNALLKCFDYCICHNSKMKEYMISQGFEADRIIELGIFDYLTNEEMTAQAGETVSIAIAGNLAPGKCGYIYKICEGGQNKDLKVYLYGNRFDEEKASENMLYQGSFKPEELIGHLNGSFGLVWDGPEIDGCKGNTGEYLRYNNPHKTSLYLAAGMPVIVWDEAAVSAFVKENNVGLLVPGLSDVAERIKEVSGEEYALMRENARNIGKKLREGGFFYAAFDECLKRAGL